jgi:hypothetical protein
MTSQSPRIYIYKITFDEVSYYYYGVHKEKTFGEEYWGSPYTHKWIWEFYTPKKQVLQLFDFTDQGWVEANEIEKRIIRPFFNTDKWCINENCAGIFSIGHQKEAGRKGGKTAYEKGVGVHGYTKEQRSENIKKNMEKIHKTQKELGIGFWGMTREQRQENGRKGEEKRKTLKLGIYGISPERRIEITKKAGKIGGSKAGNQKWMCLETGYVTNAGALTNYQKKRGIDTSKRVRIS